MYTNKPFINMKKVTDEEIEWKKRAKCSGVGSQFFFPHKDDVGGRKAAKTYCNDCPVIKPCLELSLRLYVSGIWGGTTELDRKRIRRQRLVKGE